MTSQNKTHFDKKYRNITGTNQNYCTNSGKLLVTVFLRQKPKPGNQNRNLQPSEGRMREALKP